MEALNQGGKRCRDIARETMGEVHDAMGIGRRELAEILR
jgi:hypothetical protein